METKMTRTNVLQKALEMSDHNLLCYSQTYGMSTPKEGMEAEWENAKKESDILRQMLAEFPQYSHIEHERSVYYRKYIGTVGNWSVKKNLVSEDIIEFLEIVIDTPTREHRETRIFYVDKPCSDYLLAEYDKKRHERYDAGVSASIIIYVDSINYIRQVKWQVSDVNVLKSLDEYDQKTGRKKE